MSTQVTLQVDVEDYDLKGNDFMGPFLGVLKVCGAFTSLSWLFVEFELFRTSRSSLARVLTCRVDGVGCRPYAIDGVRAVP